MCTENKGLPIAKCRCCGNPIYQNNRCYIIQAYNKEFGVLQCYTCSEDCANKALNDNVEKIKADITWLNILVDLIKNQEIKVEIAEL